MSFKIGGSSGTQNQTANTNQTETTQIDPDFKNAWLKLYGQGQDVSQIPFTPYTGDRVAPLNADQQAGIDAISAMAHGNYGEDELAGAIYRAANLPPPTSLSGNPALNAQTFTGTAPQIAQTPLFGGAKIDLSSVPGVSAPSVAQNLMQPAGAQLGPANTFGGATVNPALAAMASAPGVQAGTFGGASQGGVNIGAAHTTGPAPTTSAAQIDFNQLLRYDPTSVAGQLGAAPGAASIDRTQLPGLNAGVTADQMSRYTNPWEQDVVQSTLGDLGLARDRAINATSAAAGQAGGATWRGSRAGVADALTNEAYLRQVGDTAGQLRSLGFTTAGQLAGEDVGRALQADTSKYVTNADILGQNASLDQQARQNAAARSLAALQGDQSAGLTAGLNYSDQIANAAGTNAGFRQNTGQFNANSALDLSKFNTSALNDRQQQQALLNYQVGNANAERANAAGISSAGNQTSASIAGAQTALQAALANQNAYNQFLSANQANQQAGGLASMAALNQFGLTQGGFNQDAAQAAAQRYAQGLTSDQGAAVSTGINYQNLIGNLIGQQAGLTQGAGLAAQGILADKASQQGQMDLSTLLANITQAGDTSRFNASQALSAGQADQNAGLGYNAQQLTAANQLAGYGGTMRDWVANDANNLLMAGGVQQTNQQQQLDAQFQEFARQLGYPEEQLKAAAIPFGLYPSTAQGGTSTGNAQTTSNTNTKAKGGQLGGSIPIPGLGG